MRTHAGHSITPEELKKILAAPFRVEYAYPSSPNAQTLGKSRTGCFCVERRDGLNPPILASSHGYDTREEAEALVHILNQIAI